MNWTKELIQDYLDNWMFDKEISVNDYIEDENDNNTIVVDYSYNFKNGDFGSYHQVTGIKVLDLVGFMYSKIKKDNE